MSLHTCQKCGCRFNTEALFPAGYRVLCRDCDHAERPHLYGSVGVAIESPATASVSQGNSNLTAIVVTFIFIFALLAGLGGFFEYQRQQKLSESIDQIVKDHGNAQAEITRSTNRMQDEIERANRAAERQMQKANIEAQKASEELNRSINKKSGRH